MRRAKSTLILQRLVHFVRSDLLIALLEILYRWYARMNDENELR
jgi:hypothetical protein